MSNEWDGKVVMSTPGGPIVTMSLGDLLARKDAEIERHRAEIERLREALRRIGMPLNKVAFCRDGHEIAVLLARNALEGKP